MRKTKEPKICNQCKSTLVVGDRHNLCTKCRFNGYKKPCSNCGVEIRRSSTLCVPCANHILAKKNSEKPLSERKKRLDSRGYVMMYVPGIGDTSEHRYVMQQYLGRNLFKGENVHHINGVKNDNRIENLELWVTNQPTGQRASDLVAWANIIIERYGQLQEPSKF